MVKPSIEDFILFLVPQLFPSGLNSIKEKGGLKPSRTLWGLPKRDPLPTMPSACLLFIESYVLPAPPQQVTKAWLKNS